MAGMSIGGLVSGLDTANIVSQLMQIEALPQAALKTRVTETGQQVSALQSVNTRLAAVLSAAQHLAKDTAWNAAKATSSSTAVQASSSPGAVAGTVTFDVTAVAIPYFTASAVVAADHQLVAPGSTITLTRGTTSTEVTLDATDVVSVAAAINDAGAGVRATALRVADGQYRLQLTSTTTGAASTFSVSGLPGYDAIQRAGSDAVIDLGAGLVVSSADGTFEDVLPGTTVKVSSVQQGVQVSVANDTAASSTATKALVDSVNTLLQDMASHTRTKVAGVSTSTAGPLAGDSLLRSLSQRVLGSVSAGTTSPAPAGIQTTRDGLLTFDATAFAALIGTDPAAARAMVAGVAERLTSIVEDATGPQGTVSTSITRRQDTARDLGKQVDAWDTRLALRRTNLERQYAALETALGSLQNQSSWLAGQLGSLPSWDSGA
jgi:flagellar hook-associated protein 2